MSERTLLTVEEVGRRTSLSRSQIYNFLRDDANFPKPFRLAGTRRVVFDSLEIANWIDRQCEQARAARLSNGDEK